MNKKIGIIGLGNMGGAFYGGLQEILREEQLFGYDRGGSKKQDLGIDNFTSSTKELVGKVDVIILAVKPQSLGELAEELSGKCQDKLVISMLAGVTVERLQNVLGAKRVIRCMPNLAIKVGQGVIGWLAAVAVGTEDKELAKEIFSSFGYQLEVEEEEQLDSITALSGSGPAYYFYLSSILEKEAVKMGFTEEEARAIVENTFQGAAKLLEQGDMSSGELVKAVASKGGTTEAALESFAQDELDEVVARALENAKKRSEELSK